MRARALRRGLATSASRSKIYWEVATLKTVAPELHAAVEGAARMRLVLCDEERLGSPAAYRGLAWTDAIYHRPTREAYAALKPPQIGRDAQILPEDTHSLRGVGTTTPESMLWGKVKRVSAFDCDIHFHRPGLYGGYEYDFGDLAANLATGVSIKNVTTGTAVARIAMNLPIGQLRHMVERCWPVHVESTRFLVGGEPFEPGVHNASALLVRAPGQPPPGVRDTLRPHGVADDYALSMFEIEVDGEITPVYVHPADAVWLPEQREAFGAGAEPGQDSGLRSVLGGRATPMGGRGLAHQPYLVQEPQHALAYCRRPGVGAALHPALLLQ